MPRARETAVIEPEEFALRYARSRTHALRNVVSARPESPESTQGLI